ncbi:FCD domain-containing protein [Microvirga terrae]|uniref:FCD domain-containing protein n=1 Tax=Microvirga terrae TaxID=2740529 RepID=A0ABY5RP04_9HYPH|nr:MULTISPECIES: FCD domain-containing protein [Microvirga]MBQ0819815.1 FCD domain-containing protein [Microvirga sp. HBU67558]UVF18960.1 FCD domain-containing protein [Microvirga terrae]
MDRDVELLGKDPIGRRSDAVAEALARMIQSGTLQVGDRLPAERDLMHRYGVSRSAVREAIVSLANRGLVVTRLGHRPIVRKPDYEIAIDKVGNLVGHLVVERNGVWNLFESRIFLEAALARWAASHARRDDLEELRAALEANRQAIGHPLQFDATDAEFHAVLYRMPGNPIYPAVHKAYVEWLVQHWRSMKRGADIDQMNYAGHEAIFDAIAARDPDGAEEALRRHLVAAWEFVRSTFAADRRGRSQPPLGEA